MQVHRLTSHECQVVQVAAGAQLRCLDGLLWVTFEPQEGQRPGSDHMLSPRCSFVAPAAGRVFVSCTRRHAVASFEVEGAVVPRRQALRDVLRHWFARRMSGRAG